MVPSKNHHCKRSAQGLKIRVNEHLSESSSMAQEHGFSIRLWKSNFLYTIYFLNCLINYLLNNCFYSRNWPGLRNFHERVGIYKVRWEGSLCMREEQAPCTLRDWVFQGSRRAQDCPKAWTTVGTLVPLSCPKQLRPSPKQLLAIGLFVCLQLKRRLSANLCYL